MEYNDERYMIVIGICNPDGMDVHELLCHALYEVLSVMHNVV
jgi:hypothetical protein